jgi:uncharacterized protein (TIGR02246 family)
LPQALRAFSAVAFIPLARRLPLKPVRMDRKNIAGWLLPLFLVFVPLMVFLVLEHLRKESVTEYEQTPTAQPPRTAEESTSRAQGETPPDETVKELVRTWNQGKVESIARFFAANGTLIIPTGTSIQSRSEIEKTIAEKRSGLLKETTLSNTVAEITRPDAETAIVKGTYQLEGIKILGFNTSATGSYVLRQIKEEGRWLISRAEVNRGNKD